MPTNAKSLISLPDSRPLHLAILHAWAHASREAGGTVQSEVVGTSGRRRNCLKHAGDFIPTAVQGYTNSQARAGVALHVSNTDFTAVSSLLNTFLSFAVS